MVSTLKILSVRQTYAPLNGKATIRKLDGKYLGIELGDFVTVRHVASAEPGAVVLAHEDVSVTSIAVADLKTLAAAHGRDTVQGSEGAVLSASEKFYGKDNLGGNFVALYF